MAHWPSNRCSQQQNFLQRIQHQHLGLARRDAYAIGMLGSLIQACGCDDKTININAKSRVFSYDPAWGMQRSAILTGSGNDSINITADAGYANRWGRRSGSLILAKGMESSLLNTGSGDDVITIKAIANADRRSVMHRD